MRKYLYFILIMMFFAFGESVFAEEIIIEDERPILTNPLVESICIEETENPLEDENQIYSNSMLSNSSEGEAIEQKSLFDVLYDIIYNCEEEYYTEEDLSKTIKNLNGCVAIPVAELGFKINVDDVLAGKCYDISRLFYECGELYIEKNFYYSKYTDETDSNQYINELYIFYMTKKDTILAMRKLVDDKVNTFINSIDTDISETEKVLLVHDWIAMNTVYGYISQYVDENGQEQPLTADAKNRGHSMYGVLIDGVGVCQSYTEAMCYILPKLGVECVSCVCSDINHVWNCVKIDGKWYHVDVTWDDVKKKKIMFSETESKMIYIDCIEYNNFLIDNATMIAQKNEVSNFVYPSGKLVSGDIIHKTYEDGYIFNGFSMSCSRVSINGIDLLIFANKGFSYNDGEITNSVETNFSGEFKSYKISYDSIKSMSFKVSSPIYEDGYYYFLYADGTESSYKNNTISTDTMYTSYIQSNEKNVGSVTVIPRIATGKYTLKGVRDVEAVSELENAENVKFYFWENMKPMTYVISK